MFGVLILQVVERWSVLDPVLNLLRSTGSGGVAVANGLLSPVVVPAVLPYCRPKTVD